jgi:hypothetical protein
MRRVRALVRILLALAAAAVLPHTSLALEEQQLLTSAGTLHVLRTGTAVDLGDVSDDFVIEWSSRLQDGTVSTAILPGTDNGNFKRSLRIAYDEQTGTLLAIWTEQVSAFSQIQIATYRNGNWTNTGLLPNSGFAGAYNPQMLVTHQAVTWLDSADHVSHGTASILQIIWWEDGQYGQARLATLFLDENGFDPNALAVYDLPVLLGGGGSTSYRDVPTGAYIYPSLQPDGLSGGALATFADLHDQATKVVRITYPVDRGKPTEMGNLKWQRRHIPIVGIAAMGGIARMTPMLAYNASPESGVGTSVGAGYRPTMYWRDGDDLKYVQLDGTDWTSVRSVAIDDRMPYDKALSLVTGMGSRN